MVAPGARSFWKKWRGWLDALSRRRMLCCFLVGAFVLLLRASLLPIWPITAPTIHDEFCYLLEADTFAHGRLANPMHPMWRFFETIYVIQHPTYAAKYPPGQGLAMAAGQVLLGHPWYGVWLSCGLLAGALCWALQGWFPVRWALLGAAVSLQLCFFGYWMNSYWGGAVPAIGGALVIGAWRRIITGMPRASWILGLGAVVLVYSRPFEGLLLLAPVLLTLLRRTRQVSVWAPVVLCGAVGAAWLGFYHYRVTGNPLQMPYREYQRQYESVPQFNILPVSKEARSYPHLDLEWVDKGWLLNAYHTSRNWGFLWLRVHDWYATLKAFLGGPFLLIPLIWFAPRYFRSKKMRFPAWLAVIIVLGTFIEVPHFPHYPAPFTAVILILTVQSLRYASAGQARQLTAGLLAAFFAYTAWTDFRLIRNYRTPDRYKAPVWKKSFIERDLAGKSPGRHVIFVHYTQFKSPHEEWIYNGADIDKQRVIWAQDMGDAENRKLMAYYPGRAFWRFEPDESSDAVLPY